LLRAYFSRENCSFNLSLAKARDYIPCSMVSKLITFFDSNITSPVGHFDVSFKGVNVSDWGSIFKMNTNFL
jgi:hypothetical protein